MVHAAIVLGHVDGADLIGKVLHQGRSQEGDQSGSQERRHELEEKLEIRHGTKPH